MRASDIIKNKPYLAWYVKDPEKMSERSILEHILNYGNWEDVQEIINTLELQKCRRLFYKSLKNKRNNYSDEIKAYFIRYFAKKNANTDTK